MKQICAIFVTLSMAACATAPPKAPLRSDGFATIGQSTRVGPFVVTPRAVVEDSRCPINARCVWAGRLVLRTLIAGATWHETASLTLGEPIIIRGAALTLVSAEPGKLAGSQSSPTASRFAFEIH
jgi:hypothetical protein